MNCVMHLTCPLVLAMTMLLAGCGGDDTASTLPLTNAARGYQQIVAFGDSLTDGGTYNPTTADADPSNNIPEGLQFTTKPGNTWAGYVARDFGLPLTPNWQVNFGVVGNGGQVFELGGLNYAEGGAHILQDAANGGIVYQTIPGLGTVPVQMATCRSIANQITSYLAENGNAFNAGQLVLIQGGISDFLAFLDAVSAQPSKAADAPTVIGSTTTAMAAQIQRLRAAGATGIVYANLPDLGATPRFRGTPLAGLATTLSTNYNAAMASELQDSGVMVLDVASLFTQAIASPASFGFANVTYPACNNYSTPGDPATLSALLCSRDTLITPGADQVYLFADGLYPTARGQQIMAGRVLQQIRFSGD